MGLFSPKDTGAPGTSGAGPAFHGPAFLPAAGIIAVLAVLAVLAFYASNLGLLRPKAAGDRTSSLSFLRSMASVLRNEPFVAYVVGINVFWVGFASVAMGATFGVALLCFPLMNILAKGLGKGPTVMLSTLGMAFVLLAMGLAGFPVAGLSDFRLPRGGKTGRGHLLRCPGVIQNLMIGLVALLSGLLFDSFGNSPGHNLGVRLTGSIGAAFALFGFLAFLFFYPDDRKGLSGPEDQVRGN